MTGSSFAVGADITITFDGTVVGTVKGADIHSPGGTFTSTFIVPNKALRGTAYTVTATQSQFAAGTASAFFSLPCPSLTLNPTCGSVGVPIGVHGAGFRQDIVVSVAFTPPAGNAPVATVTPGQDSTFDTSFVVPADPPGTYDVTAVQLRTQVAARATFTIPCVKAAIKLVPTVGPPGTVITVTGTGFPIGGVVKLSWSQGIPLALPSITIGATQGFQVTVLIFPHDELGQRTMNAGPDLSSPSGPLFNIATADFLVVPGSAQPRDFSWRH